MVQRTAGNHWLQRHAIQEFHGYEGTAVLLANVVNRADVGMVKSRSRTSLATKTFEGLRIVSYFFWQELQRHESAEACVLGLVHNTHTAATELFDNAVV